MSLVIPAPFFSAAMSAVWKNMGENSVSFARWSEIPDEDNNVTLGLGLDFDLPLISIRPAIDVNSSESFRLAAHSQSEFRN